MKWSFIIKISVPILLGYVIYVHIFREEGFYNILQEFRTQDRNTLKYLILAICLMPLNWTIEAFKWKRLMDVEAPLSKRKAVKAVLTGITMGIITPFRVGDFAGRVLAVEPNRNAIALVSTFTSGVAQSVTTLITGMAGTIILIRLFSYSLVIEGLLYLSNAVICIASLLVYFNLRRLINILNRYNFSWLNFLKKVQTVDFSPSLLIEVLALSFLRYMVYVLQFVLILSYFGVIRSWMEMGAGISVIYFIQSGIPLPSFLGVFARGEISILVLSIFNINEIAILLSTLMLWIINLMIPALVGYFVLIKINVPRSLGIDV